MDVIDHLEAISASFDEVRIVAYADLSTRMVLNNVTRTKVRQEHLDTLCKQAATAFDGPLLSLVGSRTDPANDAVILRPDGIMLCLGSASDPGDALLCLCDDSVNVTALLSAGRNALAEIGEA